ncbi:sugar phosphate isomerase/epimerase family protein [Isoptericola cucumis]|uniref:Xylose isomerase n=1 Tax=Isoptericola cucumis TaxID=1776856 RepID=A0ABQ2BAF9_9MICO|nr:sugar phosphate isomerase/epimerase [Isoptericola cucumis]GGI10841.1 xylose isomerase [Isoptericola cucumis]
MSKTAAPGTSVQLYSVRDAIAADLAGAVARVAEIGYTQVEPYAFHQRTDEYAKAFADSGVTAPSGHAPVIDAEDPDVVFDAAARLGMGIVIDPFVPTDRWQTADDAKRLADRVNELTVRAAAHDVRFGYHNHQWEFTNKVDGRPVFELFAAQLAPEAVLEVDTFWATVGGADAPAVLRSLGDRVVAIHVKDGKVSGDIATVLPSSESALEVPDALRAAFENQMPAGQGDVDVAAILAAAPQALRVVEFDSYAGDVFEGIASSLAWLNENDK